MVAEVIASAAGKSGGGTSVVIPIPAGTQDGDLLIVPFMIASSGSSFTDRAAKNWWDLGSQTVNSRNWGAYARVYRNSTPSSDFTLTLNTGALVKYNVLVIRKHDVASLSDITVGARWARPDNGGSISLLTAKGLTTPENNMLVLAMTGEASNALGTYTATTPNGFVKVTEITEGPTANSEIEWVTSWQKTQATAGATGDFSLTYSVPANNGIAVQIAIPTAPVAGNLGFRIASSVESDHITLGVDLIAGTNLEIALFDGGTEVQRKTPTLDSGGWGNVLFDGLIPNHPYFVEFDIDGVRQVTKTMLVETLPLEGAPASFTVVAGSCQFTGSNHPVWDRIIDDHPKVLAHMGDLNYVNPTTVAAWRAALESSMYAPRFHELMGRVLFSWSWDNHDRIITDQGGAGSALNLGTTDPATNTEWRKLAGSTGWASSDTAGRTWVIGRVRFIQTDQWTMKDDPDAGIATPPLTFLGAAQKQWFKDTLENATEEVIVWLCQWTGQNHANGRWNSYPQETAELEAWINARPAVKAKMVMIGGDSHSLQVTDGTRTLAQGQRFAGIPNYNISGFNRSNETPAGGDGWLVDQPLRSPGQPEADWGGYSRITVEDDGDVLTFKWEGVRVDSAGVSDVMNTQTLTFGESVEPEQPSTGIYLGSEEVTGVYIGTQEVTGIYVGSSKVWP